MTDQRIPFTQWPMISFVRTFLSAATLSWVVAGLTGCGKPEAPVPAVPPVQTLILQERGAEPFRRFPGEVSAVKTSEMSFDVAGRIIERPAVQGMVAAKGALLARLDPENFQARLASANSRLANAREELARRRQLRQRNVISAAELDQFQTAFEVAEAEQREAQRALEDTQLVAPFDGRVARTIVNNFQNVQARQPVLVFQDISTLEVDIEVPERLMTMGGQGITAENARELLEGKVEFPAVAGRVFDLTLKSFSTEASPAARTFRATFTLVPPEGVNILPGMTSTVLVRRRGGAEEPPAAGTFEVPVQAVAAVEGRPILWKLNPDGATVAAVKVDLVGPSGQSMRVRSEALQPGDEVVVSGVRFLSEGMKVSRLPGPSGQ